MECTCSSPWPWGRRRRPTQPRDQPWWIENEAWQMMRQKYEKGFTKGKEQTTWKWICLLKPIEEHSATLSFFSTLHHVNSSLSKYLCIQAPCHWTQPCPTQEFSQSVGLTSKRYFRLIVVSQRFNEHKTVDFLSSIFYCCVVSCSKCFPSAYFSAFSRWCDHAIAPPTPIPPSVPRSVAVDRRRRSPWPSSLYKQQLLLGPRTVIRKAGTQNWRLKNRTKLKISIRTKNEIKNSVWIRQQCFTVLKTWLETLIKKY